MIPTAQFSGESGAGVDDSLIYGGALFNGELSIEDSNGGRISSEEYDPAPMVALQFSGEF